MISGRGVIELAARHSLACGQVVDHRLRVRLLANLELEVSGDGEGIFAGTIRYRCRRGHARVRIVTTIADDLVGRRPFLNAADGIS